MEPPIKDSPKEDKPLKKRQSKSTLWVSLFGGSTASRIAIAKGEKRTDFNGLRVWISMSTVFNS